MKKGLTGRWYLKKRLLGGYDVMVQWKYWSTDIFNLEYNATYTAYEKATLEDLTSIGLRGEQ